jgi:mono/diheme cytochrome c family protein
LDIARPSNPGGPGPAIDLQGNIENGKKIFVANCQICHGEEGKGGYPNPGTTDETVPPLNPIDETLVNPDYKIFATNVDLFLEHGSVPEGAEPTRNMPAWGDRGALAPQEIADVIAYIISLNKK